MPPVQLEFGAMGIGMGEFEAPIVAGIDTPALSFDPVFAEEIPSDMLTSFGWGALTPPLDSEPTDLSSGLSHYTKLMSSADFVPGLMWDREYAHSHAEFTPPTTPPASPTPKQCPGTPSPRGFAKRSIETKFPLDEHGLKFGQGSVASKDRKLSTKHRTPLTNATKSLTTSSLTNTTKSSTYQAKRYTTTSPADSKAFAKRQKLNVAITTTTTGMIKSVNTVNPINSINTMNTMGMMNTMSSIPKIDGLMGGACMENPDNKRKTHNVLERKRRNDLKNSYQTLREILPDLAENRRAPTGQILTLAVHYISQLQKESMDISGQLAAMRAKNLRLRNSRVTMCTSR